MCCGSGQILHITMQDEELVNSWSQGEQEWKKKCFALLKKTNIIPEVKYTKSLFCSNRCWCVPKDTAHSFAHHASKKVGTNWRGQRGEPQECYLKHNLCRKVGDNGIAKSRDERAEDRCRTTPQLQGSQWQREVSAGNRFSFAGRKNALTPG